MNWIMTFLYFAFILTFYNLSGRWITAKFKIDSDSFTKRILYGFLFVTSIQWIVAFPCQLLHLTWSLYFNILFAIYLVLFVFLITVSKPKKICFRQFLSFCKDNIISYWFIYLLVLCFAFWSMASQLPYLLMNYDDHYYLGAISQQIGSETLATKNYFNGSLMELGISRLVNTFELSYGFWSTLFHIHVPFFARGTMVLHNYLMIFFTYYAFTEIMTRRKDKKNQFLLLFFSVFLIPAGYLETMFNINLYDGWQMNTAIWYGSSVVRMIAIPACLIIFIDIINNFKLKKVLLLVVPFFAFLSFSSIFIPFACISLLMGILYFIWVKMEEKECSRIEILLFALAIFVLLGIKLGPKVLEVIIPSLSNSLVNMAGNIRNELAYFTSRNYAFVFVSASMIIFYKFWKKKRLFKIAAITCFVIVLLYSGYFNKFLLIICLGYDFVVYRMITGLQLLLILIAIAICGYLMIDKIKYLTIAMLSLCIVSSFMVFNIVKQPEYRSEEFSQLSSGMSIYGYSPDRLFLNNEMIPAVFTDMSEYFSNITQINNRVISPHVIQYEDGTLYLSVGLALTSNNVESCVSYENVRCDNIDFGDISKFVGFCEGSLKYDQIKELLELHSIDYVVTDKPSVKKDLEQVGFEVVVSSRSLAGDKVYLVKLR